MKALYKSGIILLLALAMFLADAAQAKTPMTAPTKVEECIEKCQAAIDSANRYIQNIEGINVMQTELLKKQNSKIATLEAEQNAWYRNPLLVFITGFSIGIMYNMNNNR